MNKQDVEKFNLKLNKIDIDNPLSIGNGDLVLTLDALSTHTLIEDYKDIPLTTMSDKLWFSKKLSKVSYTNIKGKLYLTSKVGQEEAFEESRRYPHKYNLFSLILVDSDNSFDKNKLSAIEQNLNLYEASLNSTFKYADKETKISAIVSQSSDVLSYSFDSENLNLKIKFLYPSYNKIGFDSSKKPLIKVLDKKEYKTIKVIYNNENDVLINIKSSTSFKIVDDSIIFDSSKVDFKIWLGEYKEFEDLSSFWDSDTDNIIHNDILDRRFILSKYLLKLNSTGIYPPSESGLTFNNWYSKFHLEMHLIHSLWLIRSNHIDLFLKTMPFYESIVKSSLKRAKLNGYKGIRFPKMTSPDGHDSPSNIGPLLVWQAPHILFMLQEIYFVKNNYDIIKPYQMLMNQILDFMVSFLSFKSDKIEMIEPLLECSESIPLEKCENPMFEIEYFRECFVRQQKIDKLNKLKSNYSYDELINKLVLPKVSNGIYLRTHGIINDLDIYPDHPTEVFAYSFFKSDRLDDEIMNNTIDFCMTKLDFTSFWGWDFPFMGLCLLKLDRIHDAIEITFNNSVNNQYRLNGHNTTPRNDLKVYLPGNGAYVLFYQELSKILAKEHTNER